MEEDDCLGDTTIAQVGVCMNPSLASSRDLRQSLQHTQNLLMLKLPLRIGSPSAHRHCLRTVQLVQPSQQLLVSSDCKYGVESAAELTLASPTPPLPRGEKVGLTGCKIVPTAVEREMLFSTTREEF